MLLCCQMTNFSDWLSNEIAQRGISPAKLAVLMRKDAGVISRILSGARHPSNETLEAIAKALDVPPAIQAALRDVNPAPAPASAVTIQPALDDLAKARKKIQEAYESDIYSIGEAETRIKEIDKRAAALKDTVAQSAKAQAERQAFYTSLDQAREILQDLPEWVLSDDPKIVNGLLSRLLRRIVVSPEGGIDITLRG